MSDLPQDALTKETAQLIAQKLQEKNPYALVQLERIIQLFGAAAAYAFLAETEQIESQGGMFTQDEQRRRSPGGVYFHLVRGRVDEQSRRIIFPPPRQRRKEHGKPPAPHRPIRLSNDERYQLLREGLRNRGEAQTVKLTLIGRPAKILERNQFVVITLTGKEPPALPKGLPELPDEEPTVYLVYIALKQWRRVRDAMQQADDRLIIEGYPFNDKRLGVIGVLAQSTTTVNLQRAKQADAQAAAELAE